MVPDGPPKDLESGGARSPPKTKGLVIGTAGHVDHGKTALVRALTGVETDRWREERERGLTIDIGFAKLRLEEGVEIGVVDVPGHEDFLKNMLAGATGVDLVLMVVAADEGPMPQTREHLAIARLLDVRRGVVALTKCDKVEEEWLELAREATRETLSEVFGHARWPVIPVSAVSGEGLEILREAILAEAAQSRGRSRDDLFRLPVDRSFTVRGTGTVVTGTVWSGRVSREDEVRILPEDTRGRVRRLEVHGEARQEIAAGRRCALALAGVDVGQVDRGSVIVSASAWRPVRRLGVRLQLLAYPGRAVEHEQRVRVYLGTAEVMARALFPDADGLAPGARGWAVLKLERPLVARVGDRFIVRFYSPVTTIGGGVVSDLDPPRLRSIDRELWRRLLEGSPVDRLKAAVEAAGDGGIEETRLPLAAGIDARVMRELLRDPPTELLALGERWFTGERMTAAMRFLRSELDRLQGLDRRASGVSLGALRASGRERFAAELVEESLARLEREETIVIEGPRVRRPRHRPQLTEEEREGKARLASSIRAGGFEPPTVADLASDLRLPDDLLHDLLQLLREEGAIVAVSPEIHLSREMVDEVEKRARRLLAGGSTVPPTGFKQEFQVSRKYLIPILEYLDRRGITRRTGEGRELVG